MQISSTMKKALPLYLLFGAASCVPSSPEDVDVVIVGGGLSGLATAKDLAKSGKTFAILEARDRVGGRVHNGAVFDLGIAELGAEFIGPTQDRVLALANDLGLKIYQEYTAGENILYRNGSLVTYTPDPATGGLPPLSPDALSEIQEVIHIYDFHASEIDVNAPWTHEYAEAWDSLTVKSFNSQYLSTSDAKFALETAVASIFSTQTNELSFLYLLSYIAAAGNETTPGALERLIGVSGGAQESRIDGGTQLLAINLADRLGWENIRLKNPVRKISKTSAGYLVQTDQLQISAKHVVVAMSPPMASRIIYEPALPAGRDQLTQRMPMGSIGKAIAVYPSPWWRKLGLNGQVLSDTGVIRATFDNTPADESFGAIMGFLEADEMRLLNSLSEDEVKKLVIKDLVKYFGPQAANATTVLLSLWDLKEYSRGGPVAYAPPSVLTDYGSFLRTPAGKIHFAGTETSSYWTGYMDGAVRSRERVAAEILSGF